MSNSMRFVTDQSKGVLGQPDSAELWSEIIAHIPDEVLLKPGVRILSVACGHCTEALLIAKRMLALGVSKEAVLDSIWLIDKYQQFTNDAVVRRGFKNVVQQDFLTWEPGMKFDVVVGNPPYQSGNGEKGGKHSLWRKFVKQGFAIASTNGLVAFVCPGFPCLAADLSDQFTKNTPLVLENDVSQYFPGIGSNIKYWIVKIGVHKKEPFVVDGAVWEYGLNSDPTKHLLAISITAKVSAYPKFECKQDKGYNSTQLKNDPLDYFEQPAGSSVFPIRHASTIKICYVSAPTECHTKNKVMMTFSGNPDFEYFDGTSHPISSCYQMSGYIEVADQKEGQSLISLYKSRLYKFLSAQGSAGIRGVTHYSLPKVDLTRAWSDAELYAHFDLTQEEIDFIEANVK